MQHHRIPARPLPDGLTPRSRCPSGYNAGIFIHSAPSSTADQGIRNVSYGCININPAAAQSPFDNYSYSYSVQVTRPLHRIGPHQEFR